MGIALEQTGEFGLIRLDGAIDIAMAADLKKSLLQALVGGKKVLLSLENVTDLDVTAMQLLWAAARSATKAGVGFALDGRAPEPVSEAFANAGLEMFSMHAQEG